MQQESEVKSRAITMIIPYYRNPKMLRVQLDAWKMYEYQSLKMIHFIIVDDGSPEPAREIFDSKDFNDFTEYGVSINLYRIKENIPWNRGGARNLGSHVATTPWLLHMDIDHILPSTCAFNLPQIGLSPRFQTFRFRRFRNGQADATRKKDAIPDKLEYGEIKPHIDSYLCVKGAYDSVGGYDEDYSGCLGGGSPFLKQLNKVAPFVVAPSSIYLEVYTHGVVADSSDMSLSRDTSEYIRRKELKEKTGKEKSINPLRFKWEQVF